MIDKAIFVCWFILHMAAAARGLGQAEARSLEYHPGLSWQEPIVPFSTFPCTLVESVIPSGASRA